MKYRSHWHTYILRSPFVSHGTNIQDMTFLLSNSHRAIHCISIITAPWNMGHIDLHTCTYWGHSSYQMELISNVWHFFYQISLELLGIITGPWNIGYTVHWPTYILRSLFASHATNILISKVWHFSYKGMTFLLSNSYRDIMHNHCTMKYGSHWPTYILRSLFVSHGTNI